MPNRYIDYVPGSATNLEHIPQASEPIEEPEVPQINEDDGHQHPLFIPFETIPDSMGLYCIYPTCPTLVLKGNGALDSICDAPTLDATGNTAEHASQSLTSVPAPPPEITCHNLYDAFSSPTAGLITCWHYSGSTSKSAADMHCLMTFLDDDSYNRDDACIFNIPHERKLIKKYLMDASNPFHTDNGWQKSSVKIRLPKEKRKCLSEADAPQLKIEGVHHQ
jgi:hypothetical protein